MAIPNYNDNNKNNWALVLVIASYGDHNLITEQQAATQDSTVQWNTCTVISKNENS